MAKPNLVFIFVDQQRYDTMAAYGNTQIEMPNLNRFAASSVVFDRAYVAEPLCTPSRSTLVTGLYPHASGCIDNNVPLPATVRSLSELLADPDYSRGYVGKWHLGDEIFAQHGFTDWVSIDDGYTHFYSPGRDRSARSSYYHYLQNQGFRPKQGKDFTRWEIARLPEEHTMAAFVGREAAGYIRAHQHQPFVLYVNFFEPHMPYFGPRDSQYAPDRVPLPPNFDVLPPPEAPIKAYLLQQAYYRRGFAPFSLQTEAEWRRLIANYWGLCSLVDTHVGTILNAVEQCNLEGNTIVVYTSDHGDMMGSHRLIAKGVQFEEAVCVPLLIRLPGQKKGWHLSSLVSQVDLVPTLLDFLGQPPAANLSGKSLRPLLEGKPISLSDVFIEYTGKSHGFGEFLGNNTIPSWMSEIAPLDEIERAFAEPVRTIITQDNWKLNCRPSGNHELYNLGEDPIERHNVIHDSRNRIVREELFRRLRAWQKTTNDLLELPPNS